MSEIDVNSILGQVRNRISELREQGQYPIGLEEELEAEFRGIMALTVARGEERLRLAQEHLESSRAAMSQLRTPPSTDSRMVFGRLVHRVMNRVVGRQFSETLNRFDAVAGRILAASELITEELRSRDGVEDHVANALSKHVVDRVAVIDHLALMIVELEARVNRLESN